MPGLAIAALAASCLAPASCTTSPVPSTVPVAVQVAVAPDVPPDVPPADPDARITYVFDVTQPEQRGLKVRIEVPPLGRDEVDLVLPTWRPGLYRILDPSATIDDVTVEFIVDDQTRRFEPEKVAKNRWRVSGTKGNAFTVRYHVEASSLEDRTRHVDLTHAFLSPSSCFLYVDGERDRAITIGGSLPSGWETAVGLPLRDPGRGRSGWVARNYDELVDSPFEVGPHASVPFDVDGIPHRIVIWPGDSSFAAEHLVADFSAIIRSTAEIFGPVPYDQYLFIIHAGDHTGGTEHVNSTVMQTTHGALAGSLNRNDAYRGLLRLAAHEFVHVWNVKQFRPAGLSPYDFERENHTDLLWLVEGTTSYYDRLLVTRAGLADGDHLLTALSKQIRSHRDRPGRLVQSLAEASFDAWTNAQLPPGRLINRTVNFYTKGSVASLLLDMQIRRASSGSADLDDVMRLLAERFPAGSPGYETSDVLAIINEVAGADFSDFFARYIDGLEPLPLEEAVRTVGLELRFVPDVPGTRFPENQRWHLGLDLREESGRLFVEAVHDRGPSWKFLSVGDEIVAMNGLQVAMDELDEFVEWAMQDHLRSREAGEARPADGLPDGAVTVTYLRRGRLYESRVMPDRVPDGRLELQRRDEASEAERRAYADWCGQPWPDADDARPDDSTTSD